VLFPTTHDPSLTQVKAEVETVTYHAEDTGFTVLKARNFSSNGSFTATGNFQAIYPGEVFEFFGDWTSHSSYGRQFKIQRAVSVRPTTRAAIERYLASGVFKGIGEKTAKKIVEKFGLETLNVLDHAPDRLSQVPTLGKKKANQILDSWKDQRAAADFMIFLGEHGLSYTFAHRIIRLYGSNAIATVIANPYRLATDIHGIGFISADKVAQSIGIAANSPLRIKAAMTYLLHQSEDQGHCFLTEEQFIESLVEALKVAREELVLSFGACSEELIASNEIFRETFTSESGQEVIAYFRSDLLIAELNVAQSILEIAAAPTIGHDQNSAAFHARVDQWIEKYCAQTGTHLSAQQIASVSEAAKNKVFVLTGGPGVGKTTTANAIIRLFTAMNKTVALAAPTGRAAQRLSEVSMSPAKTIHRLLEWAPGEGGFTRNEDNPIASEVVIVDEASMLDIRLADALLRAVRRSSQLILIGDVDQLPSVGPGNVLRDIISSNAVAFVKLSEIFRQAAESKIIQIAHSINRGESPSFSSDAGSDCRFIEASSPEAIKDIICDLVSNKLVAAGYDPMRDVQILTPMNRGDLGTVQINEEMQALLNPRKPGQQEFQRKTYFLRSGDKVIQNVNNYELSVFNGDIGFVEHANIEGIKLIVNFGGRLVRYDADQAMELRLAYAITIHKSQGSEFPVVIIPASMQHYIMLQRNLIYTGLTRARRLAIFIGSFRAINYAASNQISLRRQTRLKERISHSLIVS
jgi:exodeoxyribonuclease V alpha subunit